MDIKQLIESLIKDLYENKSLPDVLLKLQVIVHLLKNEQLTEWFNCENNGYDNNKPLPSYRILDVRFCANLIQDRGFGSFSQRNHFDLPLGLIEDEDIKEKISKLRLRQSISEINNLIIAGDKENGIIAFTPVNTSMYISLFSKLENDWRIESIWQEVSKASVQNIISQIQSKLLQFLLEINENLNLNISFTELENI
jgi:hypothetical protein